jgi:hypothetical protein
MMDFADGIPELFEGIQTFMMEEGAKLPDFTKQQVLAALANPSPVDRAVQFGEAIYAAKQDVSPEARRQAARAIEYANRFGWHGLHDDQRGEKLVAAFRRLNKEKAPSGGKWPKAEDDPQPLDRFVEPAPADAPPPPETPKP